MTGQFVRLGETERDSVTLSIDGVEAKALEGDTLMVAMLTSVEYLRESEFGDGKRAGFCLMGACQDCWVWTESGTRLRACSTPVEDGMKISTRYPEDLWSVKV